MEYALGLSLTATFTFLAIWINDTFPVGGELPEEDERATDTPKLQMPTLTIKEPAKGH
jgi:hypothetical protein